jgi:hypothetical protein
MLAFWFRAASIDNRDCACRGRFAAGGAEEKEKLAIGVPVGCKSGEERSASVHRRKVEKDSLSLCPRSLSVWSLVYKLVLFLVSFPAKPATF